MLQICERFPLKGQSLARLQRQQLRTGPIVLQMDGIVLQMDDIVWQKAAWQLKMILKVKPDQSILVRKFQALGVTGLDLDWFISYLDNRQQQVVFNGAFSSTEHSLSRVPWGSALGPLLFLAYINDLPSCTSHCSILPCININIELILYCITLLIMLQHY